MAYHSFKSLDERVQEILADPRSYEWSVQGFGMLRTYLDPNKDWRLNIWTKKLQVPNVSTIHDHPWNFTSWVFGGMLRNKRYLDIDDVIEQGLDLNGPNKLYRWARIKTGPGGGPDGDTGSIRLWERPVEKYRRGSQYSQDASEIHETTYSEGTVTLNLRDRLIDGEHARVFWPVGQEWVDAMPRDATPEEVEEVVKLALERLNERRT